MERILKAETEEALGLLKSDNAGLMADYLMTRSFGWSRDMMELRERLRQRELELRNKKTP